MKTAITVKQVREIVKQWRKQGLTVGLVPTMGFLHEGHRSLIERSTAENDRTVVSIFVNPTQFGKNEDLEQYPRDFAGDCAVCETAGTDLIFHPSPEEMYPEGFFTFVDMTTLTEGLCGGQREGHFRGVCTVVSKLFHIVAPDRAYFGQKDAQQLSVIRRMVRDLNFDLEIVGCPTIREKDGLAKSSRNAYLSKEERDAAVVVNRALQKAQEQIRAGERSAAALRQVMIQTLEAEPRAKVDYVEIVDRDNLQPVEKLKEPVLLAVAAFIGKTRLIDNAVWEETGA